MMSNETTHFNTIPIVAMLTDFGLDDGYVGAMKGVIWSLCPEARIIDLTHSISPQNIQQAAYVLLSTYRYLPPQTVIVVVVDPGVGSSRKPIAIQTPNYKWVGPDNGVFTYVMNHAKVEQIVALENPAYQLAQTSTTFHGRDIFSPVGAHLAKGVALEHLGSPLSKMVTFPNPKLLVSNEYLYGEVIHIDHFGNIITNIGHLTWDTNDMLKFAPAFPVSYAENCSKMPAIEVEACSIALGQELIIDSLSLSYASSGKNKPLALINSAGHLEIAINQGHAARELGAKVGQPVVLHFD